MNSPEDGGIFKGSREADGGKFERLPLGHGAALNSEHPAARGSRYFDESGRQ